MNIKEVGALVQAEVDKIANGVALGSVSDDGLFPVICQQGRAVVSVEAVVFEYKGESWPVDDQGNDMPAKVVAVMDANLGNGARLVDDFAKPRGMAESLIDSLCIKAECAKLGCAKQRNRR